LIGSKWNVLQLFKIETSFLNFFQRSQKIQFSQLVRLRTGLHPCLNHQQTPHGAESPGAAGKEAAGAGEENWKGNAMPGGIVGARMEMVWTGWRCLRLSPPFSWPFH